jgi:transposase
MVGRGDTGDPGRGVPAGGRICDVIARRELSSSLIYRWHWQLPEGKLAGVVASLPVFAEVQAVDPVAATPQPAPCPPGFIHIELERWRAGERECHDGYRRALTRVLSMLR